MTTNIKNLNAIRSNKMTKYFNHANKELSISYTTKGILIELKNQKPNTISGIALIDQKTLDYCLNEGLIIQK